MEQGIARQLDRLAVHHERQETPRLVIVFEEVDACGGTVDAAAQEPVSEVRHGVSFVYRASPTVVVISERSDGPQSGAVCGAPGE